MSSYLSIQLSKPGRTAFGRAELQAARGRIGSLPSFMELSNAVLDRDENQIRLDFDLSDEPNEQQVRTILRRLVSGLSLAVDHAELHIEDEPVLEVSMPFGEQATIVRHPRVPRPTSHKEDL